MEGIESSPPLNALLRCHFEERKLVWRKKLESKIGRDVSDGAIFCKPLLQRLCENCVQLDHHPQVDVLSCSAVSDAFVTLWTVAHQAPLSVRYPRQENWSGLPFPPRGHLPDSGVKPSSPTPPHLPCRRQMPCHWATGKALSPRLEAVRGFWPDYVTLGLSAWLWVWSRHCLLRDTLRTSQPLMRPAKAFLIPYRGIAAIKCWILLLICPLLALQCLEQCPTPCRQWINKYSAKQASQASLVVKNRLPVQETRETQVPSLGREDPPEDVCLQAG